MSDLKIFIADDEEPARERLKVLLGDIAPQLPTTVVGTSAAMSPSSSFSRARDGSSSSTMNTLRVMAA